MYMEPLQANGASLGLAKCVNMTLLCEVRDKYSYTTQGWTNSGVIFLFHCAIYSAKLHKKIITKTLDSYLTQFVTDETLWYSNFF